MFNFVPMLNSLNFPPSQIFLIYSIPSRVSSLGYKIGPVWVCVCLSIGLTDPKFGGGVDLDNISDEFEGQGHSSKVTRLKNCDFQMG